jgi:hypothetical protein
VFAKQIARTTLHCRVVDLVLDNVKNWTLSIPFFAKVFQQKRGPQVAPQVDYFTLIAPFYALPVTRRIISSS